MEMSETRLEDKPQFDGGKTVLLTALRRAPVVGWLVVLEGAQKGDDFRLREGKNALGTARDAEVSLRDTTVSQVHASINYKDGKFLLTDLDSTNGTFVNSGTEGISRIELHDGDTVRLGETTLKFKCL
jgi:pSer/pThr/pTyr-binding forkhead associated (FHA) protein